MPHVQIRGNVSLAEISEQLKPFKELEPSPISLDAVYLHQNETNVILRMTVVEEGRGQKFQILVSLKPDGIMLRIDPLTDVIRSDAVKRALALVAAKIRSVIPGLTYGTSNIGEYLIPGEP